MSTFARDIALFEKRKLPMPNPLDLWRENPGWPVDIDIIIDTYFNYRAKGHLPGAGGWFEQDTHIIDAFKMMDDMVEWHKQNNTKRKLPTEDWAAKRREQFQDKQ